MISKTLSLWGRGAVTLPKEWRDRFRTKNFLAIETPDGLLIKPIEEVEYYEKSPTHFGLRFPMGIEAGRLLELMNEAERSIRRKGGRRKSRRRTHG